MSRCLAAVGRDSRGPVGVILAGGLGERFFPMTDALTPKYAVPLDGSRSFLELTYARLLPLYGRERLYVVTAVEHAAVVRRLVPSLPKANLLAEPHRRNTGAAAIWASFVLGKLYGSNVVQSFFPADAWIGNAEAFLRIMRACIAESAANDRFAILGIKPTEPSTGYGYIRYGADLSGGFFAVDRFVEKPDAATAARYLAEGCYGWNAGIFTWQAARFASEVERLAPLYWKVFGPLWTGRIKAVPAKHFAALPAEPIDRVLIEKTDRLCVYPCEVGWDDIGSWEALRRMKADARGNAVNGDVRIEDSARTIVWTEPGIRTVVCGAQDLVIAQRGSYLMVCRREDVQKIKEFKKWAEAAPAVVRRAGRRSAR